MTEVKCPTCSKKVVWDASSTYRPFCSERCKLIDFGDWAAEQHKIPTKSAVKDVDMMSDEELEALANQISDQQNQ